MTNMAAIYVNNGSAEQALTFCRMAANLDPASHQARTSPSSTLARLALASALAAEGQVAPAHAEPGNALRLDPGNAEAHARLGELWLKTGDSEAAARAFTQALALDPTNSRARDGMVEVRQGLHPAQQK